MITTGVRKSYFETILNEEGKLISSYFNYASFDRYNFKVPFLEKMKSFFSKMFFFKFHDKVKFKLKEEGTSDSITRSS